MHKSKKKKTETVVKTEIKTEKDELQPLTAYLDDRVELIKQTFSALKPKTILSLAPDFMKKLDIAEIEELCLNELLGISTKRLTSIINATQCPTDTESSSDSDVENIEECISLEEISSDSDVAPVNVRGGLRARRKKKNLEEQKPAEAPKEVSVLELLELQARARAIRSQLALEPVTKIEVDSDESSSSEAKSSKAQSKKTKKSPPKSSAPKTQAKEKNSSTIANGHYEQKVENAPKPVKLKRNFRKHCQDEESDESENTPKESRPQIGPPPTEKAAPLVASKEASPRKEVKKEKSIEKQRSISPDVITILHSPETLCISDSSDDNEDEDKKSHEESKEMEDSNQKSQNSSDMNGQNEIDKEKDTPEVNESEIEDGEILDQDEETQKERGETDVQLETETESKEAPTEAEKNRNDNDMDDDENSSKTKEDTKEVSEHQIDDVISLEHEELDYETRDHLEDEPNSKSKSGPNSPQKNQNSSDGNNSDSKNDDAIDYIELHDDDSSVEGDVRAEVPVKPSKRDDQNRKYKKKSRK